MEIYLIRHTAPDIEKGICYGQSDIPLKDSFDKEVEQLLSKNPFLKSEYTVYSSPLMRCKLLAEKLFDSNIKYDNRLMELDFGDWELQPWDMIDKPALDIWMNDFVNERCPNGESYIALEKRVLGFVNEIKKYTDKKIVLVTHYGVIRALMAKHSNVLLKNSFKFKADYGELVKVDL